MTTTFSYARLSAAVDEPARTVHYLGLPAALCPNGQRTQLAVPELLLLCDDRGGERVFLFRYTRAGDFCGDTWHLDAEEAREQAAYQYPDRLGEWVDIALPMPHEVTTKDHLAVVGAALRAAFGPHA